MAVFLSLFVAHGFVGVLEYLLQSVKDRNAINSLDDISATPAHDAAEFGQLETMLVLIKHGADITVKDTVSSAINLLKTSIVVTAPIKGMKGYVWPQEMVFLINCTV